MKSEYAGVSIPEVDFEIPPKTQAGGDNFCFSFNSLFSKSLHSLKKLIIEVTTVEGIIRRTVDALKHGQNDRKVFVLMVFFIISS